jgi:hypothetical protein
LKAEVDSLKKRSGKLEITNERFREGIALLSEKLRFLKAEFATLKKQVAVAHTLDDMVHSLDLQLHRSSMTDSPGSCSVVVVLQLLCPL